MMKWLLIVFTVFLIQTQISLFSYPINLSIPLVYAFALKGLWGLSSGRKVTSYRYHIIEAKGTGFGALIGFVEDILSGVMIGPGFLSKGIIGFLSTFAYTNIVLKWTPLLGAIIIFLFTFFEGAIVIGFRMFFSDDIINLSKALKIVFVQAMINIPFGMFIMPKQ